MTDRMDKTYIILYNINLLKQAKKRELLVIGKPIQINVIQDIVPLIKNGWMSI